MKSTFTHLYGFTEDNTVPGWLFGNIDFKIMFHSFQSFLRAVLCDPHYIQKKSVFEGVFFRKNQKILKISFLHPQLTHGQS